MNINKHNYEQFLIDFIEGSLSPEMKIEMETFLNLHPNIKDEVSEFEFIDVMMNKNVSFSNKEDLKKPEITPSLHINESNYENYFIAKFENDLNEDETKELKAFMDKNTDLNKSYHLFKSSRLVANPSITFKNKNALKKRIIQRKVLYYVGSAAASILILISIFMNPFKTKESLNQRQSPATTMQAMHLLSVQAIDQKPIQRLSLVQKTFLKIEYNKSESFSRSREKTEEPLMLAQTKRIVTSINIAVFDNPRILFYRFDYIKKQKITRENYASSDENNNGRKKSILQSIFGRMKRYARKPEGNPEEKEKKKVKVSALWVIANIGLERINDMAGTNMSIPAPSNRKSEDKLTTRELNTSDTPFNHSNQD